METYNLIDTKVEHKYLAVYYRMADVAIISSVYDGMNLVAKEYVASQVDEKGVLILSELAGAAEELEGALLINPYDIEGFSTCIKKALSMPLEEKKNRMALLRNRINENDIYLKDIPFLYEIFHGFRPGDVVIGIRPSDIDVSLEAGRTGLEAGLLLLEPAGSDIWATGKKDRMKIKGRAGFRERISPGEKVFFNIPLDKLHIFDKTGGGRLDQRA